MASIRHPMHVVEAAKLGAHVGTMPPAVLRQMFQHPLTDKGLAAFLADWAKTGQSILGETRARRPNRQGAGCWIVPRTRPPPLGRRRRRSRRAADGAAEVAAYLRQHPDFLVEHPELLEVLTPPRLQRGERVVDMQQFMLKRQRAEIARLQEPAAQPDRHRRAPISRARAASTPRCWPCSPRRASSSSSRS